MTATAHKSGWLARFFQPKVDFFAMLRTHAHATLNGMVALEEWIIEGHPGRCQKVRDLEKQADEHKLEIERQLVESFVTPFDREDIYDVSVLLDEVINSGKRVAREIEALEIPGEDPFLKEMAATLVEGTRCLVQSISKNQVEASNQAALARKSEKRFLKTYRQAMKQLFTHDDFKYVLKTHEVYSCMVLTSERIDIIGERLLHVIVKIS